MLLRRSARRELFVPPILHAEPLRLRSNILPQHVLKFKSPRQRPPLPARRAGALYPRVWEVGIIDRGRCDGSETGGTLAGLLVGRERLGGRLETTDPKAEVLR